MKKILLFSIIFIFLTLFIFKTFALYSPESGANGYVSIVKYENDPLFGEGSKYAFGYYDKIKNIITQGYGTFFYVSDKTYYNIDYDISNLSKRKAISIKNKDDFIRLLKDVDELEYSLNTPYSSDTMQSLEIVMFLQKISKYVVVIASILFLTSAIYLVYVFFNNNKNRIGIIRSMGVSKRNVGIILGMQVGSIVIISAIISILCYILEYIFINLDIISVTIFDKFMYDFNYLGLISYLLVMILCILIIYLIVIYLFNKKNIKEILNKR